MQLFGMFKAENRQKSPSFLSLFGAKKSPKGTRLANI